jgi:hypothetical protein
MDITQATTRQERGACFHAHLQLVAAAMDSFIYRPLVEDEPQDWLASGELISGSARVTLVVSLHLGDYNNKTPYKATAGGIYPRTAKGESYPNYGGHPTISFQLTRPASQIAADITRRLLPEYRTHFEKVARWVHNSDAAAVILQETRDKMIDAGFTFPSHSPTEGYMQFARGEKLDHARPHVHVFGGYVDLKLRNVSPDRARAVLEVLDLLPEPVYV